MCGCDCHRFPDAYCAKACCSGARPVPAGTVTARPDSVRQSFDKMLDHWARTGVVRPSTPSPAYPVIRCQGCQADLDLAKMYDCSDPVMVRRLRDFTGDVMLRGSIRICDDCFEVARGVVA